MTHNRTAKDIRFYLISTLLLIAVILAAFFRFYKLDQIPPGFTFDESSHALDALDILNGQFFLISPRLQQAPAGYMYFVAAAFQLFGVSRTVERAVSATFGVLLVILIFFATKEMFKGNAIVRPQAEAISAPQPEDRFNLRPCSDAEQKSIWIAIFSALLLSTSFWGIITSRKGFEYIVPPLFALLAIYLFWRGYRSPRWGILFVSAICAALGFYMYTGGAAFLPVIPTALFVSLILHRFWPKTPAAFAPVSWRVFIIYTLAVGLLALPMYVRLTGGEKPEVERSIKLLVFTQNELPISGIQLFIDNLMAYAQPFLALGGDHRWVSNVAGRPVLNPALAVSFVAGIFICLWRIRQLPYLLLLVYWGGVMAPATLTMAGNTISAYNFRMAGALPVTHIIIGLAWAELFVWLKAWLTHWLPTTHVAFWLALIPFALFGLIWLPLQSYQDYFIRWANEPEVGRAHDMRMVALIERMGRETDPQAIFILPRDPREPRPNYTIDFLYHGPTPFRYVILDDNTIRQTLTKELTGYRTVHLITNTEGGRERLQKQATGHPLIPYLLQRYGQFVGQEKTENYTIENYRLNSTRVDFAAHQRQGVPADFEPLSAVIADEVKLVGIKRELAGNTLAIDLAWQGWVEPSELTANYTVFVQLLNQESQRVAGVDVLPEKPFTELDRLEVMTTHYTIPVETVPPGAYALLVGLYYFSDQQLVNVGAVTLEDFVVFPKS